ncbi:hypothetical protein DSO52_26100 [Salmonella enterica]|nr:hypothetical protein [Salmonella enterica]
MATADPKRKVLIPLCHRLFNRITIKQYGYSGFQMRLSPVIAGITVSKKRPSHLPKTLNE